VGRHDRAVDLPAGVFYAHFQHKARLGSPSLVLNESAHSNKGVKRRIAVSPLMTLLLFAGCRGNFNQHRDNSLSALLGVISSFVCKCNCSIPIRLWVPAHAGSTALWLKQPPSPPAGCSQLSGFRGVKKGPGCAEHKDQARAVSFCLCCHWERDL